VFAFGSHPCFVALKWFSAFLIFAALMLLCGCGLGSGSVTASPPGATFQVTVTAPAEGSGMVTSSPAGINCPGTCAASFPQSTQVYLTAIPTGSYYFDGWSGGCSGIGRCRLGKSSARRVTASFKRGGLLSVTMAGSGSGTVLSTPAGINCPSTCSVAFPLNTSITLSEDPAAGSMFSSWAGVCSGDSSCSVILAGSQSVSATFNSTGSTGSTANVIAYIFTPDNFLFTTYEFALLSNGELEATNKTIQPFLMTGTSHGLIADLPGPNNDRWPTGNLQAFAVSANGDLQAQGNPISFAVDKYASSLASNSTYVYAVSDLGVFGFEDTGTGLTALVPVQETVARPCSTATENTSQCAYAGSLVLGQSDAFFNQSAAWQSSPPTSELSSFVLTGSQLSGQRLLVQTLPAPQIDAASGDFGYGLTSDASGTFITLCTTQQSLSCSINVLANGQSVSDGFVQVLTNPAGSFLFAPVFDGSEAPRVRVFSINSSSGALTEISGSPFLTGQYYFSYAAVDPTGHFLLIADSSCDGSGACINGGGLTSMSIDATTGALSVISNVVDGEQPYNIYAVALTQ
jgi:hypothetical protein